MLAEVSEISIQMDAQWNYYDRVGLDNFSILPYATDVNDDLSNGKFLNYQLFQNHPNPFNPSTKIKFIIPASTLNPFSKGEGTFVQLKVYDVLGNEVATLVDEYREAGRYEVEFSGHSDEGQILSSGVYFYQLKAGEFIQAKKMVYLK